MKSKSWYAVCIFILFCLSTCNMESRAVPDHRVSPSITPTTNSQFLITRVPPSITPLTNSELLITDVSDNRQEFPAGAIPKYEKLEISFQIQNTVAQNYLFPYDPNPPNGVDLTTAGYQGISVDAYFSPDRWQTIYQQPAFYYEYFDDRIKPDRDNQDRGWYYPTGNFGWKVRFAPDQPGTWEYKIVAKDASGTAESTPIAVTVVDSTEHGFIKVSAADPRYFEFDDGTLFYPLGFQGFSSYDSPWSGVEPFTTYKENGVNLIRTWISGIYGTAWLEWIGGRNIYNGYLPRSGIIPFYDPILKRTTLAQKFDYEIEGDTGWFDACRYRFWNHVEAVKPNTDYRLQIKYRGESISGPRNPAFPEYGLVAKIGDDWDDTCYEPGLNDVVTNYGGNTSDWSYIEGTWNSGEHNFLSQIFVALENVKEGNAYVDSISLREDLGNNAFGPEIIGEPSMQYELYIPQRTAFELDKFVEAAEQAGVYLKLVINDKNDKMYLKLDDDGSYVVGDDNLDGFYGVGRSVNKTRWLQGAWWRYLQARWGYSTAIHSWELTNEGDPWNNDHYALADEFGKSMHCRVFGFPVGEGDGKACSYDHPNDHLVTTSFWDSFPDKNFWASPDYPNIDYADVHAYVSTGWLENPAYEVDTALFHIDYSLAVRSSLDMFANQAGVSTKPIVRGETGIDFLDEQTENPDLALDLKGVWLHNLIWAGLDPGALTELYWWRELLHNQPGPDGQTGLYEVYSYFLDFIRDIPLNNGNYQDALANLSNPSLRVVGQKDTANNRAHLWVQNQNYTWRNVVEGADNISGLSGTISITGFSPDLTLQVEWHEFSTAGLPSIRLSSVTTDKNGNLILDLPSDPEITDAGIKIGDY